MVLVCDICDIWDGVGVVVMGFLGFESSGEESWVLGWGDLVVVED